MMRTVLIFVMTLTVSGMALAQSGTLKGKVLDAGTGEAIAFANVTVESNGQIITGAMTDFDGNFTIKPIPSGKFDVKASSVGYKSQMQNGVQILSGKITFLDFKISTSVQKLNEVEVKDYKVPLISKDQTTTGGSVTSEEIAKMPGRSADAVATTVGGVYSENGEVGSIRGAREEATVYYIDGVKVVGSNSIPKSATAQVDVITGGIPAKYGDVTGGIISITTKEPAKEMFGAVELVTSRFLDPYDFNLAEFMITGPMFSKKTVDPYDSTKTRKNVIAGYFLSLSGNYVKDNFPAAGGMWAANDDVIASLLEQPYRTNESGEGTLLNSEFLTADNFHKVKARENAQQKQLAITAKIDVKPSRNVNITFGGTVDYQNDKIWSIYNSMFNSNNNGQQISLTTRGYVRLTQKFQSLDERENANALIKNAYYQIQADWSKNTQTRQNETHKDNLFNYGYVGKFDTYKIRTYSWTDTLAGFGSGVYQHDAFADTLVDFTPGTVNEDLAKYTSFYYNLYPEGSFMYTNADLVRYGGGLLNGDLPNAVYPVNFGGYTSPGTPFGTFYKYDQSQFRVSASGSADIKDHEISLGFEFEQLDERYFGVAPIGLWQLARDLTNLHIQERDLDNPNLVYDANGVFQDTIWYNRLYNDTNQTQFDIRLRETLGMPKNGTNFIDLDSYDPNLLSIDYFSADELLNSGNNLVTYYGYDHHGNKLKSKPSLNEFFTEKDASGRYLREVAAFQPIYAAAYIQDKFAFNDLVFNVGVRVDRFDANQMVLKDPYSLYDTKKLSEVPGTLNPNGAHPSNVPSDAVVYADNVYQPTTILGYREGTDPSEVIWYNASGTQINDPTIISSGSGMAPIRAGNDSMMSINAFTDYEPQINVMPRIAFSFPISDVALFFAHYDILTKRPMDGVRLDPIQYLFIQNQDVVNNPNLKPEKTIDYELGFQQKLSNTSSIKLSAFYREMRDMAQVQYIYGAYPTKYMTYTNIDFGTVKGFTVSYDLRRTGNVTLRANYTLQFANGTGSNAETSRALIQTGQPNLRTSIPLDFDQRHAFVANIDYRYGSGRDYNGPKVAGYDLLQNTGLNIVLNYGTGSPYSKRDVNTQLLVGSINGSRKPARTTINVRFDRDFELKFGKEGKSKAGLNVYVDINNILNTMNVINVYQTTGNPDDDGFLANAKNQAVINSLNDPESFRNYYSMWINYPYNYSVPRTVRLGVQMTF